MACRYIGIGQQVFCLKEGGKWKELAVVTDHQKDNYSVRFDDGSVERLVSLCFVLSLSILCE